MEDMKAHTFPDILVWIERLDIVISTYARGISTLFVCNDDIKKGTFFMFRLLCDIQGFVQDPVGIYILLLRKENKSVIHQSYVFKKYKVRSERKKKLHVDTGVRLVKLNQKEKKLRGIIIGKQDKKHSVDGRISKKTVSIIRQGS